MAPVSTTWFWLLVFLTGVALGIGILIVGFAVHARRERRMTGFEVRPVERVEQGHD